ncbi:MAG: PAS domain-containing protein, partial [Bacteroidetes bacterium]|nr:PAS domain-containing protein [Bacteroidota bacterium]
ESEITERKLQEEALIRSEAKLSAVMNNIPDFIFYKNIDGVYEMGNESMARFLNISPKEIEGKTDFDLHSKAVAEAIIRDDKELMRLKQTRTVEGEIEIEGKEKVLLETTKAVIQDQNGMVKGLVGVSRDVTAIKKAKEKEAAYIKDLEKINQELDQFAYIVSHDLKAPLRAINNLSTWIQEDLEDKMDQDTHEQFALLRGRVLRMEGLINGILQYSRAGRITATEQTVDLNELVKEITDALSDGYKANIEIDENLPIIETEKVALDQVFSNLISNALKYNNKELAQVKISSKTNGQFHHFRIEDNGPGIAKEFREKVFVIFQTLNARDEVESTGVGLAIVKKIIEDKGGKLYIDDSELGGAAFNFSWPKVYTKKQQNVN